MKPERMNRISWKYFYCWVALILAIESYLGNAFSRSNFFAKLPRHKENLSGKNTPKYFATQIDEPSTKTIKEIDSDLGIDDDYEQDDLVDMVTSKLEELTGLWYSDDFYGAHGREWVKVSPTLVGETASSALEATKVTGDPHVPAGCVTFRTDQWPGVGDKVAAYIQVRADPNDPDGFSWLPGDLTLVAKDQILLGCFYNPFMRSEGTFHRETKEEEEEN